MCVLGEYGASEHHRPVSNTPTLVSGLSPLGASGLVESCASESGTNCVPREEEQKNAARLLADEPLDLYRATTYVLSHFLLATVMIDSSGGTVDGPS